MLCNELEVDHGTCTPLVFSLYSNMGRECKMFYSRLSQLISDNRNFSKSITINWIRTKFYFTLLKSSLLCLRSSRTVAEKYQSSNVTIMFKSDMPKFELCHSLPHLHIFILFIYFAFILYIIIYITFLTHL